jgi:hypothetical protein
MHQETTARAVVRSQDRVSLLTVGKLAPDDMYPSRQPAILIRTEQIKHLTLDRSEEENRPNGAKERDPRMGARDAASESKGFARWPPTGAWTLAEKNGPII